LMSLIINYVETLSILIKQMTVIDVMAQESVIDVVALINYYVVRLKLFRPKAEGVRKAQLTHFGGERADSRNKHGFKLSRIPVFPNSLQPTYLSYLFYLN
ncbi:MAG: hypothetical protein JRI94_06140, partial [Deltaproteobacteria bacterium]|nr:hypothetical protein [Deltaproteobacteria bacterium]